MESTPLPFYRWGNWNQVRPRNLPENVQREKEIKAWVPPFIHVFVHATNIHLPSNTCQVQCLFSGIPGLWVNSGANFWIPCSIMTSLSSPAFASPAAFSAPCPNPSLSKWGPPQFTLAWVSMYRGSHTCDPRVPPLTRSLQDHLVPPCAQKHTSSDWSQGLKPHSCTGVLGAGKEVHGGTWDLRARNRPLSFCPDRGMCRRGHRGAPGGWLSAGRMSRQQQQFTHQPLPTRPEAGAV